MTNENISVTEVQNENSVIAERRAKLLKLREHGVAYPNDFVRKDLFGDLNEKYGNKTAEELAAIADTSAKSFKTLVGAKPIIAMLSHSTKGSAKHPLVDKVVKAVEIAHEQYPGLTLDGELQTDAAIVPSVAKSKAPGSEVAGKANVLIFPNLDCVFPRMYSGYGFLY